MTRFSHAHAFEIKSLDPIETHDNDNHVDVDDAIAALTTTTTAALTKSAADYKNLEHQLGKLQAKLARPGAHYGPSADNDDPLAGERKSLADYIRRDVAIKSGTG